jgi:hypothetical protein
LPGAIEYNHEKQQSRQHLSGPAFDPRNSEYKAGLPTTAKFFSYKNSYFLKY